MMPHLYTEQEVISILMNLANGIGLCAKGDIMPTRYKTRTNINGEEHWVTGRTLKDLLEAYLELYIREGTVMPAFISQVSASHKTPSVGEYIDQFYSLYKQKQQSLTKQTRINTIKKHILPRFGKIQLSDLQLRDIQLWFNELEQNGYSHESLLKIKNIFSPALDAAVEDGYISRNPFKSTRLVIGGTETKHHKAIPKEKMLVMRKSIPNILDFSQRALLVLLCYTGMRMEEILGIKWEDFDFSNNWIYIERAVVHPKRNQPEVKEPKSKTSKRRIPLPDPVKDALNPKKKSGFILAKPTDQTGETPLSYTESRNLFKRIVLQFNLQGFSGHDFRDTCATEWREAGIPTDVIARLLGHSKSDITETRYVNYRDEVFQGVRAVMNNQNGSNL